MSVNRQHSDLVHNCKPTNVVHIDILNFDSYSDSIGIARSEDTVKNLGQWLLEAARNASGGTPRGRAGRSASSATAVFLLRPRSRHRRIGAGMHGLSTAYHHTTVNVISSFPDCAARAAPSDSPDSSRAAGCNRRPAG